jgi:hypothetical protein
LTKPPRKFLRRFFQKATAVKGAQPLGAELRKRRFLSLAFLLRLYVPKERRKTDAVNRTTTAKQTISK